MAQTLVLLGDVSIEIRNIALSFRNPHVMQFFSLLYVAQAGLEFTILLPLLPECQDYSCAPPRLLFQSYLSIYLLGYNI
jgi:hypothetical protein